MTLPAPSQIRAEMEINLLRFLCDARSEIVARRRVLSLMQNYCWSERDSTVFFESIRLLFERDPKQILAHLPAELTRRGFPDMPCEILAEPTGLNSTSALALAETLVPRSNSEK